MNKVRNYEVKQAKIGPDFKRSWISENSIIVFKMVNYLKIVERSRKKK